mmetsp:Transcript_17779/g.47961  ORF Transcript_17779/g.47961 Transcript_17779/m.47961 type:complete len:214 (-) Transcript_17779:2669-3310(-)
MSSGATSSPAWSRAFSVHSAKALAVSCAVACVAARTFFSASSTLLNTSLLSMSSFLLEMLFFVVSSPAATWSRRAWNFSSSAAVGSATDGVNPSAVVFWVSRKVRVLLTTSFEALATASRSAKAVLVASMERSSSLLKNGASASTALFTASSASLRCVSASVNMPCTTTFSERARIRPCAPWSFSSSSFTRGSNFSAAVSEMACSRSCDWRVS